MELIKLNVYDCCGKAFTFDVEATSTVVELSNKIVDSVDLPEKPVILFCGHMLDTEKRISYYKIKDGSAIKLVRPFKPTMEIRVNFLKNDNNQLFLAVNGSTTVFEVKRKIEKKLKVNVNDQALIFNDDYLDNEKTLLECEIVNDSVLDLLSF